MTSHRAVARSGQGPALPLQFGHGVACPYADFLTALAPVIHRLSSRDLLLESTQGCSPHQPKSCPYEAEIHAALGRDACGGAALSAARCRPPSGANINRRQPSTTEAAGQARPTAQAGH